MMKRFIVFIIIFLSSLILVRSIKASLPIESDLSHSRYIVKFRSFTPNFYRSRLFKSIPRAVSEKLAPPNTYVLKIPEESRRDYLQRLKNNLLVDYVEADFIAHAFDVPNDTYYSNQWGLKTIEAEGAWDVAHGKSSVIIAIVDTGVKGNHPDLSGKIVKAADCTVYSSCHSTTARDNNGHGTHVAGITSALTNNSFGVAGLSWEGKISSVKVLDRHGSGYYSWVANGIYWAADHGAKVINLSLGGSSPSQTLENAVNYAWSKGVVVVAAAGNNESSNFVYPAYYAHVVSVAATNSSDQKASFSSYGSWVDLAAPGVSIISTYKRSYAYLSGTSMSAPFVSGLAGLLFAHNLSLTNDQVVSKIETTADDIAGTGTYWQFGRINACRALDCNGVVSPTPSPSQIPSPSLTPTFSPTSTPTSSSTPSPTPTSTSTPTPTPTVTPTLTPAPTSSPTPTPSSTPTPKPWWCRYFPHSRYCQ